MQAVRLLVACFQLLFFFSLDLLASAPLREKWEVILLNDQHIGFSHTLVLEQSTSQGSQFTSKAHQEVQVKRGGTLLRLQSTSEITETSEGKVLHFQSATQGAGSTKKLEGFRHKNDIIVESGSSRQHYRAIAHALGPEALDREWKRLPLKPGASGSAILFSAEAPHLKVEVTATIIGKEKVTVLGQEQTLWKREETTSLMPGVPIIRYLNEKKETELAHFPLPGIGLVTLRRSDSQEAGQALGAAEVFTPTLIHPSPPLPPLSSLRQIKYRLTSSSQEDLPMDHGPYQHLLEKSPGTAVIERTLPHIKPGNAHYSLPFSGDAALTPYLHSSAYIEITPTIHQLARQALGQETNPVRAAHRITRFVRTYITQKHLGVGFASAQETAQTKQGDCTEHAVLVAALGRAVGLPTRIVVGLAYVPQNFLNNSPESSGTFGFHMWNEAYIAPNLWLPIDAALGRYTLGHIAIQKTSLNEANPLVELSLPIFHLLRGLHIEVLETQLQ